MSSSLSSFALLSLFDLAGEAVAAEVELWGVLHVGCAEHLEELEA